MSRVRPQAFNQEAFNTTAMQRAFGGGVQRGRSAGASPDSVAGSGIPYQEIQEKMFRRGSDIVDQTLQARELEMRRQQEEERLRLDQRKLADATALDRGRLGLDYKRAASEHEQASRRQVNADNALLLERDVANDRSKLQNREMAYRESQPNEIDIMSHRFKQEGIDMLDKEAAAMFGDLRKLNLDPEGQAALRELSGAYRGLQSKRSKMLPEQYAETLGQIMNAANIANLPSYALEEPSPTEQFNKRKFDLGDGRTGYLKANGDIGVIEPREVVGGEASPSNMSVMTPTERYRRLMSGTTEADIKAQKTVKDAARERVILSQSPEKQDTYRPTPQEIDEEIRRSFQEDFELQQLAILGPKQVDPANLSSQGNNQQAEIDALRQIGVQPKPGMEPTPAGPAPGQQAPVGQTPVRPGQQPRDPEMEDRSTVERVLMQRKDTPEVQGLAKQLQKAGIADRQLTDFVHPRAIRMEMAMGSKDPVAAVAAKAAKAIEGGKKNNFLTADPMRKKVMEEAKVEVVPAEKVDSLPPETFYLDEEYDLQKTPPKKKPKPQGFDTGDMSRPENVPAPKPGGWWERSFDVPISSF